MAKHTSLSDLFTDIADAIRILNGTTEKIVADDFPTAILSAVKYSISKTLNDSTISNSASSISHGSSYTATLSADSGHQIDSIKVTMGGVDITSSAVSDNKISIAKVTGKIVITVTTSSIGMTYSLELYKVNSIAAFEGGQFTDVSLNTDNSNIVLIDMDTGMIIGQLHGKVNIELPLYTTKNLGVGFMGDIKYHCWGIYNVGYNVAGDQEFYEINARKVPLSQETQLEDLNGMSFDGVYHFDFTPVGDAEKIVFMYAQYPNILPLALPSSDIASWKVEPTFSKTYGFTLGVVDGMSDYLASSDTYYISDLLYMADLYEDGLIDVYNEPMTASLYKATEVILYNMGIDTIAELLNNNTSGDYTYYGVIQAIDVDGVTVLQEYAISELIKNGFIASLNNDGDFTASTFTPSVIFNEFMFLRVVISKQMRPDSVVTYSAV